MCFRELCKVLILESVFYWNWWREYFLQLTYWLVTVWKILTCCPQSSMVSVKTGILWQCLFEIFFKNQIEIIYQTLRIWIDFSLSFQLQHQGPYPLASTPLPHLHPLKTFLTKQQCHRDLTDAWVPLIEGPTRTQKCAIVAVTIWTQTLHCYTIITVWGDITLTMRTPIIGATRALTVNIIIKWDSVFILGRRVILNHIIWSRLLLATSSFQVSQFLSLSKFNLNLFFSKNIKTNFYNDFH